MHGYQSAPHPHLYGQQVPSELPRLPASGFGKFMFWFQWITPLITASQLVFGRAILFGQDLGWAMFLIAVFVAPAWVLIHWLGCGLTFVPVYSRRARALPTVSGSLNLATIPLTILLSMFIEDGTDHPDAAGYASFASRAFGMSDNAVFAALLISFTLVVGCFVAYVVTAFLKPKWMRARARN